MKLICVLIFLPQKFDNIEPLIMYKPLCIESGKRDKEAKAMTEIIVRVHRPTLTPEEHARRMKQIKAAAIEVIKDARRKEVRDAAKL